MQSQVDAIESEYIRLNITRTVHQVRQYVSWHSKSQIDLRPAFQRRDAWTAKERSFLIDTVLRGMPMPLVILRQEPGLSLEPRQEVVDGQQRLTTLLAFISPEAFTPQQRFTIHKAHSRALANKSFAQLSDDLKTRILDYEVSTHVLPSSVGDDIVLRIFAKLNATGAKLKAQELRNAQFHGFFKTFAFETALTYLDFWRSREIFTNEAIGRMQEVEFTSDLAMYVLYGVTGANPKRLERLYRDFEDDFPDEIETRRRFEIVVGTIDEKLGGRLPQLEFHKTTWFYTLFSEVHDRMFGTERQGQTPFLSYKKAASIGNQFWAKIPEVSALIKQPNLFAPDQARLFTARTTHLNTRIARHGFLREQLL